MAIAPIAIAPVEEAPSGRSPPVEEAIATKTLKAALTLSMAITDNT